MLKKDSKTSLPAALAVAQPAKPKWVAAIASTMTAALVNSVKCSLLLAAVVELKRKFHSSRHQAKLFIAATASKQISGIKI